MLALCVLSFLNIELLAASFPLLAFCSCSCLFNAFHITNTWRDGLGTGHRKEWNGEMPSRTQSNKAGWGENHTACDVTHFYRQTASARQNHVHCIWSNRQCFPTRFLFDTLQQDQCINAIWISMDNWNDCCPKADPGVVDQCIQHSCLHPAADNCHSIDSASFDLWFVKKWLPLSQQNAHLLCVFCADLECLMLFANVLLQNWWQPDVPSFKNPIVSFLFCCHFSALHHDAWAEWALSSCSVRDADDKWVQMKHWLSNCKIRCLWHPDHWCCLHRGNNLWQEQTKREEMNIFAHGEVNNKPKHMSFRIHVVLSGCLQVASDLSLSFAIISLLFAKCKLIFQVGS